MPPDHSGLIFPDPRFWSWGGSRSDIGISARARRGSDRVSGTIVMILLFNPEHYNDIGACTKSNVLAVPIAEPT